MSSIDLDAPLTFFRVAFLPEDWAAILLKSCRTGRSAQRVGPVRGLAHPRFQAWLRAKNAEGCSVYVSVNAVRRGARSRRREAIGTVRHVIVDADRDAAGVLARVHARSDLPPPSYVLHSSPGRAHVLWRVAGLTIDEVEALQKRLARDLGTDLAATSAAQLTRLPGFLNPKYSPPHPVRMEYRDVDRTYTPADFSGLNIALAKSSPHAARREDHGVAGDAVERARQYLRRVPPAVAGQRGDRHTFLLCCRLVLGLGLGETAALDALREWNAGCVPPWTAEELRGKLRRAGRRATA